VQEITQDVLGPQHLGALAVAYKDGSESLAGTIVGYERRRFDGDPYALVYFGFVPDRAPWGDTSSAHVAIGGSRRSQLFLA
jgi:hypothetical protein